MRKTVKDVLNEAADLVDKDWFNGSGNGTWCAETAISRCSEYRHELWDASIAHFLSHVGIEPGNIALDTAKVFGWNDDQPDAGTVSAALRAAAASFYDPAAHDD